jgi:hypothetical protein
VFVNMERPAQLLWVGLPDGDAPRRQSSATPLDATTSGLLLLYLTRTPRDSAASYAGFTKNRLNGG